MSNKEKSVIPVPESFQVQLSRLLGSSSNEASKKYRTKKEWKGVLYKILMELYEYMEANVETDKMHSEILYDCLIAARESLQYDNFWPGYVEGITRFALILMGDYPDHRRRKGGRKKKDHYKLNLSRTLAYIQDSDQRVRTLLEASRIGFPPLSCNMKMFRSRD